MRILVVEDIQALMGNGVPGSGGIDVAFGQCSCYNDIQRWRSQDRRAQHLDAALATLSNIEGPSRILNYGLARR